MFAIIAMTNNNAELGHLLHLILKNSYHHQEKPYFYKSCKLYFN